MVKFGGPENPDNNEPTSSNDDFLDELDKKAGEKLTDDPNAARKFIEAVMEDIDLDSEEQNVNRLNNPDYLKELIEKVKKNPIMDYEAKEKMIKRLQDLLNELGGKENN